MFPDGAAVNEALRALARPETRAAESGAVRSVLAPVGADAATGQGRPLSTRSRNSWYSCIARASFAASAIARGDGRYPKHLASFAKTDLLVLDDIGLAKLDSYNRRDLLEDR